MNAMTITAPRQRGFMLYTLIVALALLAVMTIALKVVSAQRDSEREAHAATKAQFAGFKAEVARLGKEAQAKADKQKAADKLAKEKADAKHLTDVAALNAAIKRLRDNRNRSGSNIVPSAPPGAARPDLITFDQTALDRALRDFDAGVAGLLAEGDHARVGLDTARRWAAGEVGP